MNKKILVLISVLSAIPFIADAATTCSKANLTRCLDSACAINLSSNPAARCQYCGTASAGTPAAGNAMRSVSVGTSAKYSFTDKELKAAPSDPGARYAWATAECIKKVAGCTPDDVTDNYDTLIEQSCKAAGITAEMSNLRAAAAKTKTKSSCKTDVQACIIDSKRCGPDYSACAENADFDKFFSGCSVEATGCDDYFNDIRTELVAARDTAIKNADTIIETIVASYKSEREKKLASVKSNCTDNAGREACINTVCERSMANKCGAGYASERSMATQLCKFYDLACDTLK
ncbi:MAG: hypothetical protein K2I81_00500 [Alphaproteobacteria bacterium]|nr:hypothetical protein [Alphaproteobacteria bacterium]